MFEIKALFEVAVAAKYFHSSILVVGCLPALHRQVPLGRLLRLFEHKLKALVRLPFLLHAHHLPYLSLILLEDALFLLL